MATGARIGGGRNRVDAEVDPQRRAIGKVLAQVHGRAEHRDASTVLKGMELDVDLVVLRPVRTGDQQDRARNRAGQTADTLPVHHRVWAPLSTTSHRNTIVASLTASPRKYWNMLPPGLQST